MVYANTLCKKLLNVKSAVVEECDFYSDQNGVSHIRIQARPNRWHEGRPEKGHRTGAEFQREIQRQYLPYIVSNIATWDSCSS